MKIHLFASVLFSIFCTISASRVEKASKADLKSIQDLYNAQAAIKYAQIQNDAVDAFDGIEREPSASLNKDELSINNLDEYFQGDVDLSVQQVQEIRQMFQNNQRKKRKIGISPIYHIWEASKPISFDFSDSIPLNTRDLIRKAMMLWQQHTCVRFEENGPFVDRLEFFDGGGCSSYVGKVGGTQGISISTPGCDTVGIISHEIGHALGSFHEQARPDQFRYINVNFNNIPVKRWNNFQPVHSTVADTYQLPYDTGSVMHYGPYGFAENPYVPTIRTLEQSHQATIGQREGPSFLDYQAINAAYGCTMNCSPIQCERDGYVNPNNCSECMCPDGTWGRFCERVKPSNYQCGGIIQADKGFQYVQSPHYPEYYPSGVECVWLIQAPEGGRVFLEFVDTFDFRCDVTCDKSYVEIKYHKDKRLTGSRFCCSKTPQDKYISFNNEMIVILRGFGGNSKGFSARFWSDIDNGNITTKVVRTTTPSPSSSLPTYRPRVLSTTSTPHISWISSTIKPQRVRTARPRTTTREIFTLPTIPPTPQPSPTTVYSTSTSTTTTTTTTRPITTTTRPTTTVANFLSKSLVPEFSTTSTLPTLLTTEDTNSVTGILKSEDCECGEWTEWEGGCNQECGGCGHRKRTRTCQKENCRKEEKRPCNFQTCPSGTNFLINNGEFHILWRGCCVGLFRSGNECSAMEANSNSILTILTSLFNFEDEKRKQSQHNHPEQQIR